PSSGRSTPRVGPRRSCSSLGPATNFRPLMATAGDVRIKKGSRVVAAVDLRGVPEGTTGKVKVIDGFEWVRAWVQFDNGVWLGSVSADKLVPEDDWENFKVRRVQEAEEAERRKEEAATAPVAAAADAGS